MAIVVHIGYVTKTPNTLLIIFQLRLFIGVLLRN